MRSLERHLSVQVKALAAHVGNYEAVSLHTHIFPSTASHHGVPAMVRDAAFESVSVPCFNFLQSQHVLREWFFVYGAWLSVAYC
mmetsp:Transcript_10833/g.24808  ORF Transcript_10833/g.24808 Transcript_10833/m.24808 type:complete len:84 (+) Transcript_10833:1393-1644(+)